MRDAEFVRSAADAALLRDERAFDEVVFLHLDQPRAAGLGWDIRCLTQRRRGSVECFMVCLLFLCPVWCQTCRYGCG